jgi:beta-galactosidase
VSARQASVTDPGYENAAQQQQQRRMGQTLFSDWTPENAAAHEENVEVYSNCDEVELVLNGKPLGSKPLNADASPRNWPVAYEAGTLRAVGKNKGQVAATYELRTAGKPAKIVLTTDRETVRANWDGVAFVTARVTDENGVTVPSADAVVSFRASGPGVIAATDNADNASHESYQAAERHAYEGWAVALVKAKAAGEIEVRAEAAGLKAGLVKVQGVAR